MTKASAIRPHTQRFCNLQVSVCQVPNARTIALRVWFRGGARHETLPGTAYATGRMLTEGTTRADSNELSLRFENRGVSVSSFGAFEAHGITVDALATDLEDAAEWLEELVFDSTFTHERCEWTKEQMLAELGSLLDDPDTRAGWAFLEQVYEPNPAARSILGTPKDIARIDAQGCRDFHERAMRSGVYLSLAGDVDPEVWARRLCQSLGPRVLALGEPLAWPDVPAPRGSTSHYREVPVRSDQAHVYAGHCTVELAHPDLFALEVSGVILGAGSGLNGRMPYRLREQLGLAYSVDAATVRGAGLDPGRFVVSLATTRDLAAKAEEALRAELDLYLEAGPSEEEVRSAVAYLLGREPFRRETARQWADLSADSIFYGLPIWDPAWRGEAVAGLDAAQVLEVSRRHIKPAELRVTVGLAE